MTCAQINVLIDIDRIKQHVFNTTIISILIAYLTKTCFDEQTRGYLKIPVGKYSFPRSKKCN